MMDSKIEEVQKRVDSNSTLQHCMIHMILRRPLKDSSYCFCVLLEKEILNVPNPLLIREGRAINEYYELFFFFSSALTE
jgi:hypothetical protein